MRSSHLFVVAAVLLSCLSSCSDEPKGPAPEEPGIEESVVEVPGALRGTPWGEVISLKQTLWFMLEQGDTEGDALLEDVDAWYVEHTDRIRASCVEASSRPIADPDQWTAQLSAFSRWQAEVATARSQTLRRRLQGSRQLERLERFDQLCLAAVTATATAAAPGPDSAWERYITLRREIHGLLDRGLAKPTQTIKACEDWYEEHQEEVSRVCRRMSAGSAAQENADHIASYTSYLSTEGQRTVEKLIAKIPAMVKDPSKAKKLLELSGRFDRICAESSAPQL